MNMLRGLKKGRNVTLKGVGFLFLSIMKRAFCKFVLQYVGRHESGIVGLGFYVKYW